MSKVESTSPPLSQDSLTTTHSTSSTQSRNPFSLNPSNKKNNVHWGPEMIELKPDDIFRLYFQNVKGLRLGNNGLDILDYFCHMKNIGVDIIGANELNLDTRHPLVQRLLYRHSNQVWEHSHLKTSSSKISFNSTRKPGGTLIGVTGNTVGRVEAHYSDPMGRFSSLTLLGRMGKHITVISAYQVPKNSNLSGPTTAHTQQVLQLKQIGFPEQNPRRQFCDALDRFLTDKIDAGHQIILGGDFNDEIGSTMQGFTYIVAKHNLTDVLRVQLGTTDEPATYARGSKRLDYVFMTADIASSVVACGAEPFNHRFFSDHRGLYVDLKLSGLFDRNLSPLAGPQFRDIRSGNPHQIRKYIQALKRGFDASHVKARTAVL
jgi:exonuclease III